MRGETQRLERLLGWFKWHCLKGKRLKSAFCVSVESTAPRPSAKREPEPNEAVNRGGIRRRRMGRRREKRLVSREHIAPGMFASLDVCTIKSIGCL